MEINGYTIEPGANLSGADLSGADLPDANLQGALLRNANLSGADLRYANLRYADLQGADLRDVDLRYANLRNAILRSALLEGADLRDANLRCVDLRRADLYGADLRCANLYGANLRDVDLRDVDLRYADLCGTCLDPEAIIPYQDLSELGDVKDGYVYAWRTARSMHVGNNVYESGQTYVAPSFSVDEMSSCHPGIYLAPRDYLIAQYGLTTFVRVRALVSDVLRAGDKYRARRIEVL